MKTMLPEPPDRADTVPLRAHRDRETFYPFPDDRVTYRTAESDYRGLARTDLSFHTLLPSGHDRVDEVRAVHLVDSRVRAVRSILLLHGLGPLRPDTCLPMAASFATCGFPTLVVELPHTGARRGSGERSGAMYGSLDATRALPAYEQAVVDVRTARRWLVARDAAGTAGGAGDPVIAGISLGALIAVIAAALEPGFGCLVPILGGADLDALVFDGIHGFAMRRRLARAGISPADRRLARERYAAYLDAVRAADHPLDVRAAYHYFLFDPLTFAPHLRTRPALLINARFDPVIPASAARQLWFELGTPERRLLWGTHWVGAPWRSLITRHVVEFLHSPRSTGSRRPADTRALMR